MSHVLAVHDANDDPRDLDPPRHRRHLDVKRRDGDVRDQFPGKLTRCRPHTRQIQNPADKRSEEVMHLLLERQDLLSQLGQRPALPAAPAHQLAPRRLRNVVSDMTGDRLGPSVSQDFAAIVGCCPYAAAILFFLSPPGRMPRWTTLDRAGLWHPSMLPAAQARPANLVPA